MSECLYHYIVEGQGRVCFLLQLEWDITHNYDTILYIYRDCAQYRYCRVIVFIQYLFTEMKFYHVDLYNCKDLLQKPWMKYNKWPIHNYKITITSATFTTITERGYVTKIARALWFSPIRYQLKTRIVRVDSNLKF